MASEREQCELLDWASREVLLPRLELAATFWSRFRGLQFRRGLPEDTGLLLAPCNSVHTIGMLFPIDVAFLDETGRVFEVRPHVRPNRVCVPHAKGKCRFVLETSAGALSLEPRTRVGIRTAKLMPRVLDPLLMND